MNVDQLAADVRRHFAASGYFIDDWRFKAAIEEALSNQVTKPRSGPPRRMWINQPSTNQLYHNLHGLNVVAVPDGGEDDYRVFFTSGDIVSQYMPANALSLGWQVTKSPINYVVGHNDNKDIKAYTETYSQAVAWVDQRRLADPEGVARGDYYIDPLNEEKAQAEMAAYEVTKPLGYDVFDYDGTGHLEIQKDDEAGIYENDHMAIQAAVEDTLRGDTRAADIVREVLFNHHNNRPKSPSPSPECLALDAMCIWEAMLQDEEIWEQLDPIRSAEGTCALRQLVLVDLAPEVHKAWNDEFDGWSFDWDFVPKWLSYHLRLDPTLQSVEEHSDVVTKLLRSDFKKEYPK